MLCEADVIIVKACLTLFQLFTDEVINLEDDQWADINIVSGCLKLYLRELPDPLVPFRMFRSFIEAASKLCMGMVVEGM